MQISAIGTIESPFIELSDMPIQPGGATGMRGRIVLEPELAEGLADLGGFSHIIVLYHFHRAGEAKLTVVPFLDPAPHGVFATRAPTRPNKIGLSILKLIRVNDNCIEVDNIDILNGTPLLDVKPYVPEFDQPGGCIRTGWLEDNDNSSLATRSDRRFA